MHERNESMDQHHKKEDLRLTPVHFIVDAREQGRKKKGEKKTGIPSLMQLHKVRSRCCFFFYAYRFLFLGS